MNKIREKKKFSMTATNYIARIYDTVLSIPGMNENVKIELRISRKNVLLLSKVIERGISPKDSTDKESILDIAPEETLKQLSEISDELLKKAGLTDMNEKLKSF